MPSAAQIRGLAIVRSMLPAGANGPDVNIRANRTMGPGIAFSTWPHPHGGRGGEYHETVVMPDADGPEREAAKDRLRQILARWLEIETVIADMLDEARACDEDDLGNHVDDDMPTPAWRHHCPAPLRVAMDRAGLGERERLDLVETSGSFTIGAYTVRIHECDLRELPMGVAARGRGCRTVRRCTVEAPGVYFSQGINRCYLRIDRLVPQTIQSSLIGRSPSLLIDMPGLDAPGLAVLGAEFSTGRQRVTFDLSRNFTMMSTPPSLRRQND